MDTTKNALFSPCIRQCCLNDEDICLGCHRSLYEITHWTEVDCETRRQFLDNAKNRKKNLQKTLD